MCAIATVDRRRFKFHRRFASRGLLLVATPAQRSLMREAKYSLRLAYKNPCKGSLGDGGNLARGRPIPTFLASLVLQRFSFLKLFLTTPQASGLASVGFSSPPPPCLFVPLVKATAPPQVKGYQPPLGIDGSASPSTGFSASLSTGFSARLSTSFSIGFPTGSSTTYNQLSTFTHSNEILHSSVLQTATAVRMPC